MEQYGNTTTYNMETVLLQNIKTSQYWAASALALDTVEEIIDEIYNCVTDIEPWMSGNARGPSTAFNLLYRLCQLKPTAKQIRVMLDHRDSPYIRAIGFLYLRYTLNPRYLWQWFEKYLYDTEEFSPSPEGLGCTVTMGDFVRDIMLDQFYFETIFPRVPKPVLDEIVANLKEHGLPTAARGNAGQGGEDRRGFDDASGKRPASVKASLSVAMGQRAPNRAGVREQGRGLGAVNQLDRGGPRGGAGSQHRSPSPLEPRDDRRERERERGSARYDSRERGADERGGRRREGSRERDYKRRDYDRRDDDRRRYDDRSSRDYRRDERRYDDHDRERSSRDYNRRDVRDRDYDRRREDRDRDHDRRRDRSRSRSREGVRSGSRDARDVFKERLAGGVSADQLKDRY